MTNVIGTLNEKSLHADLKEWYARPGDNFEVKVDGYVIDIIRSELLIEIQTSNFSALKKKLTKLIQQNHLRLVYPIAQEKWIVKLPQEVGGETKRRKSPKRGSYADLFRELVRFPQLVLRPNFSMDVLLIQEEEVRRFEGTRGWRRRGWVTDERYLLEIVDWKRFEKPADYASFIPGDLPDHFTTKDLAECTGQPRWLAQKMAYCLRKMDLINPVGNRTRSILYERVD